MREGAAVTVQRIAGAWCVGAKRAGAYRLREVLAEVGIVLADVPDGGADPFAGAFAACRGARGEVRIRRTRSDVVPEPAALRKSPSDFRARLDGPRMVHEREERADSRGHADSPVSPH